jgi:hypothetical protein
MGARSVRDVVAAGVSVKKEERNNLSTSNRLKLARAAREGGTDKFTFFESDGQTGGDFRAVYDLHMSLEALSKAITFYDMGDVFQILPSKTIKLLESKLDVYFTTQTNINTTSDILATDPTNASLKTDLADAVVAREVALKEIE